MSFPEKIWSKTSEKSCSFGKRNVSLLKWLISLEKSGLYGEVTSRQLLYYVGMWRKWIGRGVADPLLCLAESPCPPTLYRSRKRSKERAKPRVSPAQLVLYCDAIKSISLGEGGGTSAHE